MSGILGLNNDELDATEEVASLSKQKLEQFGGELCPARLILHHTQKVLLGSSKLSLEEDVE